MLRRFKADLLAAPAKFVPLVISLLQITKGFKRMKNIFVGNLSFGATEDSLPVAIYKLTVRLGAPTLSRIAIPVRPEALDSLK